MAMKETQSLSYDEFGSQLADESDRRWAVLIPSAETQKEVHSSIIELKSDVIRLGRDASCDFALPVMQISGVHLEIRRQYDETHKPLAHALVFDLSSNGTYIGGTKIGKGNQRVISDTDELVLIKPSPRDKRTGKPRIGISFTFSIVRSSDEVASVEGDYIWKERLGSGSFACVSRAIERATGRQVAIKDINKKNWRTQAKSADMRVMMREVDIMESLTHAHVVSVDRVYDTDDSLFIVMQLLTGGDLQQRIQEWKQKSATGALPQPNCRDVMWQLIDALRYLHSKNIAHRDIKPENILLKDEGWHVYLTDFGLAKIMDVENSEYLKTQCGTRMFLAPEVASAGHSKRRYGFSVDYWSLGMVLYVMLAGHKAYDESKGPLLQLVAKGAVAYPKSWLKMPDAYDLVSHMLEKKATARFGYEQISRHPWMNAGPRHALNGNRPLPMSLGTEVTEVTKAIGHSLRRVRLSAHRRTRDGRPVPMSLDTAFKEPNTAKRRSVVRGKKQAAALSTVEEGANECSVVSKTTALTAASGLRKRRKRSRVERDDVKEEDFEFEAIGDAKDYSMYPKKARLNSGVPSVMSVDNVELVPFDSVVVSGDDDDSASDN